MKKYYCIKDGQRLYFDRPERGFYAAMGLNGSAQGQLHYFGMDNGVTCLMPIYETSSGQIAIIPNLSGMEYSENLKKWVPA
jgi:hypothetical protein